MDQKSNSFLETEKIGRLMRKYSVPCIISLLVAALYNIVDQIFIANADYLGSYGNAANTVVFPLTIVSRSFFADSSYMLSFSVLCSCVCSRLISPSVSSWHKQDNTLMHQSPGHIQRRTPYNF